MGSLPMRSSCFNTTVSLLGSSPSQALDRSMAARAARTDRAGA
ncbi:MAG: hypothetical protein AVDCRST_MAG70-1457 [uncultured Thermomicrobiales bacterium]|uniref:Uncharacterized protein n=1 Tax=uncultured Thermomicrobiales bacterium TaxID=1645740 RepID=A0A6J4US74_9BACT|nr:MAG: hypothetical protein AVDCRST_MAG70-1457 [uncultured Thermomicrobiales bacterium]